MNIFMLIAIVKNPIRMYISRHSLSHINWDVHAHKGGIRIRFKLSLLSRIIAAELVVGISVPLPTFRQTL